jgi:hypothetical protein
MVRVCVCVCVCVCVDLYVSFLTKVICIQELYTENNNKNELTNM